MQVLVCILCACSHVKRGGPLCADPCIRGLHHNIYMINAYFAGEKKKRKKKNLRPRRRVYLGAHQLCRLILIVAMETECCQRSPDSKRASVSLCDSLSSSLSFLALSPFAFLIFLASHQGLPWFPPTASLLPSLLPSLSPRTSYPPSHSCILPGDCCAIDY